MNDHVRHLRAVTALPSRGSALEALDRCLSAGHDLAALLRELPEVLAPLLPVSDRVSIAFVEPEPDQLRFYRLLPPLEAVPSPAPRVRVQGTVVGQVARDGVPCAVADVRQDRNITFGHASHDGIRSTASVPFRVAGRIAGVLNVGSSTVGACQPAMLDGLLDLAARIGPALLAAERPVPAFGGTELVGRSAVFRALLRQAERAAASEATVLLTGETGVGKTALARAIHRHSARHTAPFVSVHVADLPASLIESELFGHERGAFTGASQRRSGRFELAHRGTVFLDEIGEAPLPVQSKLLRVLQDGAFERVGGTTTITSDVRVIAATHRDLHDAAACGEFRRDLMFRLEVIPLHVPPLRERFEDLELLAETVLRRLSANRTQPLSLTAAAWARLRAHDWPGNVRELESVLMRAAVLEDGPELSLSQLGGPGRPSRAAASTGGASDEWPTLDEHERRYLRRVLDHTGGVIEGPLGAARIVGLQPSTLRSRMQRLGVRARATDGGDHAR